MDSVVTNLSVSDGQDLLPDTTKYIFLAAIFIITFISSVLPLQIVSNLRNVVDPEKRYLYRRIVGVLNCFAGGVFLGTALLDLFPHVTSVFKEVLPKSTFPVAEFIIAFGFLIILSSEQIVLDCGERSSDVRNTIERLQSRNVQLERETLTSENQTSEEPAQPIKHHLSENEESKNFKSKFHSVLLLMALSLHSMFEGLTIGLLQSSTIVLQVFIAILFHKIPVAFSLGLNLVQSELKLTAVIHFDLWFSLMTPIGTGIGLILRKVVPSVNLNLLNAVLIGLATGTFIFIIFVEILPKELKQGRSRLLNLLFLIIGFSFVCAAMLIQTKIP